MEEENSWIRELVRAIQALFTIPKLILCSILWASSRSVRSHGHGVSLDFILLFCVGVVLGLMNLLSTWLFT